MKCIKKMHNPIPKKEQFVKKSHKHDANLQQNSTMYFQIGLIVCLLITYSLFETKFVEQPLNISERIHLEDESAEYVMDDFKVYEEPTSEEIPQPDEKVMLPEDPTIVDNDTELSKALDIIAAEQNTNSDEPLDPGSIRLIEAPEETFSIIGVERVPIYPGCESSTTNDERRQCMSEKINRLINKKFNREMASNLGLTGIQKIYVQFKIDKTGNITDIQASAPHDKLADEANRVIGQIPQMTPGRQSNKNVSVIYMQPIKFQVQE